MSNPEPEREPDPDAPGTGASKPLDAPDHDRELPEPNEPA